MNSLEIRSLPWVLCLHLKLDSMTKIYFTMFNHAFKIQLRFTSAQKGYSKRLVIFPQPSLTFYLPYDYMAVRVSFISMGLALAESLTFYSHGVASWLNRVLL